MSPHPASTVVLVRANPQLEVFLVRRHDKIAFMGGAHVFPGGRVDQADYLEHPELICDGVAGAHRRMPDVSNDAAVAFHITAIRELFEEAGILLARRNGRLVSLQSSDSVRLTDCRQDLVAGALTMWELADREGLRLALDALAYFAHWVTPAIETRRFDTRFFIAVAPDNQAAAHDTHAT